MLHSAASAIVTLVERGLVREAFGLRRKIMSAMLKAYAAYTRSPNSATAGGAVAVAAIAGANALGATATTAFVSEPTSLTAGLL